MGERMSWFHEFKSDGLFITFYVDGRFTLCYGIDYTGDAQMGYAFCSLNDEYDGTIGLWVSLRKFMDNSGFTDQNQRQAVENDCQKSIEALFK